MNKKTPLSLNLKFDCDMNWHEMQGDNRSKFCNKCQKTVHNISDLTQAESIKLLSNRSDICVSFLAKSDEVIFKEPAIFQLRSKQNINKSIKGASLFLSLLLGLSMQADAQINKIEDQHSKIEVCKTENVNKRIEIDGVVTDEQQSIIAGVVIKFYKDNQKVKELITDDNGKFNIADLPAGEYNIEFQTDGFEKSNLNKFLLGSNEKILLHVEMKLSSTSDIIVVEAPAIDQNAIKAKEEPRVVRKMGIYVDLKSKPKKVDEKK